MKKKWAAWGAWALTAACLYFFENNTGSRIVLLYTLLCPLFPFFRRAFLSADAPAGRPVTAPDTAVERRPAGKEEDEPEPGEVRPYRPGDPAGRIHWKLSARKGEVLVREDAPGTAVSGEESRMPAGARPEPGEGKPRRGFALCLAAAAVICLLALLLVPEANRGAQALCNRLFAASEAVNRYVYERFPVPEGQNVLPAAAAGAVLLLSAAGLTALLRSRALTMGAMGACALFQVYFGLAFPGWVLVPLYAAAALLLARRPFRRRELAACGAALAAVCLAVAVLAPGADAATEEASEAVRDRLSRMAGQLTGTAAEAPEGETETRHVLPLSLETGSGEAGTDKEYRPVAEEEEQISMPHWTDYARTALMALLAVALLVLPFTPFLLLNARRKKAEEARKAFESEDAGEAVRAIFRQVITWLEETGNGAGNRLYRDWAGELPAWMPEGYAGRFARCAEAWEEAAYSRHAVAEEKRREALALLKETEAALWNRAGRRERIRLKFRMG